MNQLPPTNFSRTLDAEFWRIAEQENKSMEDLVVEIAELINRSRRQIYNYRSGKWSLEERFIPLLCQRFKSLALANSVLAACGDVEIEIPDRFDLTKMVSKTVRCNLHCYEEYLHAFESDGIEPHELQKLRELMEEVVRDAYQFLEIAARDCERRSQTQNREIKPVILQ